MKALDKVLYVSLGLLCTIFLMTTPELSALKLGLMMFMCAGLIELRLYLK